MVGDRFAAHAGHDDVKVDPALKRNPGKITALGAGERSFEARPLRSAAFVPGELAERRASEMAAAAEVLARDPDGNPVAVRQGRILATAFHPELTDDPRLHALLMAMAPESESAYPHVPGMKDR